MEKQRIKLTNLMKLPYTSLQNNEKYELLEVLGHTEIVAFVGKYFRKINPVTLFFWTFNVLIMSFIGYRIGQEVQQKTFVFENLSTIGFSFLFLFSVGIILHENIHYLAYKFLGAKNGSVKYQWRKMIFLASADKFVANRNEFLFVAILPFFIINLLAILPMFFVGGAWFYFFGFTLFVHTALCSGDFALISFLYEHRKKTIYTYDDLDENKSYFYIRIV